MYGYAVHVKRFIVEGKTRTESPQLTTGSGPASTRGITTRRRRNVRFDLGIGAAKAARIAGHKGRYVRLSGEDSDLRAPLSESGSRQMTQGTVPLRFDGYSRGLG
jgi:hypothetical protein